MFRRCLLFLFVAILFSCNGNSLLLQEPSISELEKGFKNVPDSTKLAVYWYWISDNISKEGVVKDLQAMKKAGINRAFIGNVFQESVSSGKVKIFSDEWWDILHQALKTATELGIEIGIFNSPGWSQSGGPWVKEEESMRYLSSSSINVHGTGKQQEIMLPIIDDGQDVKILAYPKIPEVSKSWIIDKKGGQKLEIVMYAPDKNMRSLIFKTDSFIKTSAELFVKKNGEYKLVKSFELNRSNPSVNVGFEPYAPIVIALPEDDSKEYKLILDKNSVAKGVVTLTNKPYIERYPEKSLAKMFQTPLPMWNDYLWDSQPTVDKSMVVAPEQVIDLTSYPIKNNKLSWDVPYGDWTIVRYAMKTTKAMNGPASIEGTGLEVDKMNKKHIRKHFNAFLGEILNRIPAEDRKSFKISVLDSYEKGSLNWTDDMEEHFVKVYGYSPVAYLPVLHGEVIGSKDISDRFLWDLRRLIADRVSYDYVGGLRAICNEHGLTTWLENYGHWGFPGEFLQYGGQSDEIGGEFWSEGSLGDIENRAASSCAHIYGKRKVWAESFTAGFKSYARYPFLMKQRGDRFFTEGINSTLLHVYIHQPYDDKYPGVNADFGNEFNRHNTWFSQIDVFIDYLKRCNMMLQQGEYVADVAYFIGEDTPKMTGVTDPKLPYGYSFDYINAEVIKEAKIINGLLTLKSGMKYKVLVLPKLKTMRPELLEKIKSLVNDGLIIIGTKPEKSPSLVGFPNADVNVKRISDELWSSKTFGKGKIYPEEYDFQSLLIENGIEPDFNVSQEKSVLFIHRKLNDGDIYFISNQLDETIDFTGKFRVKGCSPELWNPLTGEIRELTDFQETDKGISIPLSLKGFESSFIVFRKSDKKPMKSNICNYPKPTLIKSIKGSWNVRFRQPALGLDTVVVMNDLKDWTDFNEEKLKYFSGTASYTTDLYIPELSNNNDVLYLNLGKVMVMAKVYINDKYVGGVWTNPYQLPISEFVKKGSNKVEIVVVNNWVNRIIGDLRLPKEERKTWTNVIPWGKDSELQSSGLLGPVEVVSLPIGAYLR